MVLRKNKKGEVTLSKLVIGMLLFLGLIMTISTLTVDLVGKYGRTELPEFKTYERYYNNSQQFSNDFANTISTNSSSGSTGERFLDLMLGDTTRSVKFLLGSTTHFTGIVTNTGQQVNAIAIPDPVIYTLLALLGFVVGYLVVRAISSWGKDV